MGVVLDVVGQSVVDDMGKIVDIKSACCHISCHKQLSEVGAELLHSEVALCLTKVSMQGLGIISIAYELIGYLLRLYLSTAEDDGINLRIIVDNALQGEVFILCMHEVVDVVDMFGTFVPTTHYNLFMVAQIALGYALYLLAHSGREEQRVTLVRHTTEYLVDAIREAHCEHLVSLIKHHIRNIIEFCHSTMHEVDESTWCSYYNLHSLAQGLHLRYYIGTAIDSLNMNAWQVLGKVLHITGNLQAELPRRAEHYGLGILTRGIDALQQRYAECRSLTGSCLCQCNDIVPVSQQIWYHFLLYRHWLYKS